MSNNLAVFGGFSKDAAQEEAAKVDTKKNYLDKLPVGTTVLRLMPPSIGRDRPWVTVHQHFVRLPGVEKPLVFNCPLKMLNQPCPACERAAQLGQSPNPQDQKMAKEWSPQFRAFANVIDRKNPEKGPQLWGFGLMIFKRLTYFRENEDFYGKDYTDPFSGRDIVVQRTGTNMDTRYQVDLAQKDAALAKSEEQMIEWAKLMADLDEVAKVLTWAEITERAKKAQADAGGGGSQPQTQARAAVAAAPAQPTIDADLGKVSDSNNPF